MLGRGLESLIPSNKEGRKKEEREISPKPEEEKQSVVKPTSAAKKEFIDDSAKKPPESIFWIEIGQIQSNPYQPRRDFNQEAIKELAASIQEVGFLQPLVVTKTEEITENGAKVNYQLIAGERRFLAAKMLGLTQAPVVIKKIAAASNRLEMAIIENLQRTDLNPLEEARAFARLQEEFSLSQREIAQRIGKSREAVANRMRLLDLPSNIQEAIYQDKVNESQAMTLLAVRDLKHQQKLFRELLAGEIHTNEDLRTTIKKRQIQMRNRDPEKSFTEKQLEEALTARVKIRKNRQDHDKGKIIIQFFSAGELDAIVKKICGD